MANFTIKSIKEIYNDLYASYTTLRNQYGDNTPLLEKAVVKSVFYAIAGVAGVIWRLAVWIYKQCFPQTAELDALKYWGNLIGIDYQDGGAAVVTLTLNDVTADYLAAGTVYKDLTTGLIFKTISQAAAEDGVITATAQCTTSGEDGNLAVGTVLNIANPLDGIPSTAEITAIVTEGTEDEELETYRSRVLSKFRNKSEIGAPVDYYNWVMEVSGMADALPYVLNEGTVTIYCVATGSGLDRTPTGSVTPNPFPYWDDGNFTEFEGEGQFLEIAYAIEGTEEGAHDRRPCMAAVDLEPPNYSGFEIEITGLTTTSYNDEIKEALISLLDAKRPHLVVLGYEESAALINASQLSAACIEAAGGATFTSFVLTDDDGAEISETTLGIGCLAYLKTLTINGTAVYTTESDTDEDTSDTDTDEDSDE